MQRRRLLQTAAAGFAVAAAPRLARAQAPTLSGGSVPYSIIDVHTHPLLPKFRQTLAADPAHASPPGTLAGMPEPAWSRDLHIENMDKHGIAISVASTPGVASGIAGKNSARQARALNEELATFVASNPSRLGAFAVVPMDDMDAALSEMAYALDVLKLDGVYADTHLAGKYLGDASFDPWFAEMNRRGVTLFVHPTVPPGFNPATSKMNVAVLEFMFDSTRMVTNMVLSGAKQKFPKVNIISTHGGGTIPYLAQRIASAGQFPWAYPGGPKLTPPEIMASLGSFYYDLTLSTSPTSLDAIRSLVPPERLLMGFDFPMMPPQSIAPATKSFAEYAGLNADAKKNIAELNARRLFPRFA